MNKLKKLFSNFTRHKKETKIKQKRIYKFNPNYKTAPGETLKELMESMKLDIKKLSKRSELSPKVIEGILEGIEKITPETCIKLEKSTGVCFWGNLESNYRK
jgi:plasmid maintenance system antidote protein VapI